MNLGLGTLDTFSSAHGLELPVVEVGREAGSDFERDAALLAIAVEHQEELIATTIGIETDMGFFGVPGTQRD